MAELPPLVVRVMADTKSLVSGLASAQKSTSAFAKASSLYYGIAGAAVVKFAASSVKAFVAEQEAVGRTNAILKSTGGAANVTAAHMDELTSTMQDQILVQDEVIRNAGNLLLTFKNVANQGEGLNAVFDRGLKAAADLAATGFGDLDSAAKMLGKALNDPVAGLTALGRAGVTFTQVQKDTIKALVESNDLLGAQKIILAEVESQVGGTAEATADVGRGAKEMAIAWSEFQEAIGEALLPLLEDTAGALKTLMPLLSAVGSNLQVLLGVFLGYKALKFLPGLFRTIAMNATTMGLGTLANGANAMANGMSAISAAAGPMAIGLAAGTTAFALLRESTSAADQAIEAAWQTMVDATPGTEAFTAAVRELNEVASDPNSFYAQFVNFAIPALDAMDQHARTAADRGFSQLRHSIQETDGVVNGLTASSGDASNALNTLALAHKAVARAAREQWASELALADGLLGIEGAAISAKQAQQDLAAAKRDSKTTSLEMRAAELRVLETQGALEQSVLSFIQAKIEEGATVEQARAKLIEWGTAAGMSRGQVNALVTRVLALNNALNAIPEHIYSTIHISTVGGIPAGVGGGIGGPGPGGQTEASAGPSFSMPDAGKVSGSSGRTSTKTLNVYVGTAYGLDDLDRKLEESLTRSLGRWGSV